MLTCWKELSIGRAVGIHAGGVRCGQLEGDQSGEFADFATGVDGNASGLAIARRRDEPAGVRICAEAGYMATQVMYCVLIVELSLNMATKASQAAS
jgi:hypothetical protein